MSMRLYNVGYDLGISRMRSSLEAGAAPFSLSRMLVSSLTGGRYLLFAESQLDLPMRDLRFAGSYNGAALASRARIERFSDARLDFARFLAQQVQIQPYSIVIENPLVAPSDPCVASFESPLLVSDDKVYHCISDGRSTDQTYHALVESCTAPFLTGICTTAIWLEGQPVNLFLADASNQTMLVFTNALDDEGFLLWIPDKSFTTLFRDPDIQGTDP